jgi:hypothetical protein
MLAYREAMSLDTPALVSGLSEMLGAQLVAYLGSVKETRAVRQWTARERAPSPAIVKRLRDAYQIARLLSATNPHDVVQAWFRGMNPMLGDVPPARLLREGETDEAAHRVLAAARDFAAASS